MLDSFSFQRILINGTVMSLVLGLVVLGSLKYNARLWLQDYPKPIRDKVPPLSASEKRGRVVVGMVLISILFGGLILTTLQLRTQPAEALSFGAAYLHIFLMLMIFNFFDAVVLDLFVITLLKPRFVIIPGMEYLFHDYRKHVGGFLKGMIFCVVASVPFAILTIR